jgi:predicted RNase H-like nuclease (RuvC/YqgF family)
MISDSKENVSKLKGRKEEILNQLEKEFGIKTIAEAEKKLKTLNKELEETETEIKSSFNQLKENYEW